MLTRKATSRREAERGGGRHGGREQGAGFPGRRGKRGGAAASVGSFYGPLPWKTFTTPKGLDYRIWVWEPLP